MDHLHEINILIDKASAIAGSDYKLGKLLGCGQQKVSNWRHGHRPCPVKYQVLLADIAGLDPVATLARATVQAEEGTALGDMLMRVLGKASRATGAVLGFVGASAVGVYSMLTFSAEKIQCIDRQTS